MLRRRRRPPKNEAIQFSFDSFLDLVTNVVGIIIRLILVTWVGARSYHASMEWIDTEPSTETKSHQLPAPRASDDPLYTQMEIARAEMEDAKARLSAQLQELDVVENKTKQTHAQLLTLASRAALLSAEVKTLDTASKERSAQVRQVNLSVEEIRQRAKKLLAEIKTLEKQPGARKQLKYHAPLSRTVHGDELFFECRNGRVTFIDLPAFMIEIKQSMDGVSNELKTSWRVDRTTSAIGPYRLRYTIERERTVLEEGTAPSGSSFRYGLSEWIVEPLTAQRGETLQTALTPKSEFRQLVDPLDANLTVVTFWVYPDSFEMFRQLRDHLYERGLDVAGRPLPPGSPIAASKNGTASRGQ